MDTLLNHLNFDVVVIAASAGGLEALQILFSQLPADFPAPVVIVKHTGESAPRLLDRILGRKSDLKMHWAETGACLEPGCAYLAPPGVHTKVDGNLRLVLLDTPRVNFVRPAANVLFRSAAQVFQQRAIGVVLTGMGSDGAAGACEIKQMGGRILVQDPHTCVAPQMARATLTKGAVDFVLPIERIASALVTLCMVPGADRIFSIPPKYTAHLEPAYRYRPASNSSSLSSSRMF